MWFLDLLRDNFSKLHGVNSYLLASPITVKLDRNSYTKGYFVTISVPKLKATRVRSGGCFVTYKSTDSVTVENIKHKVLMY